MFEEESDQNDSMAQNNSFIQSVECLIETIREKDAENDFNVKEQLNLLENFRFQRNEIDENNLKSIFFKFLDVLAKKEIESFWICDGKLSEFQLNTYRIITNIILRIESNIVTDSIMFDQTDLESMKYDHLFFVMVKRLGYELKYRENQEQIDLILLFVANLVHRTVCVPWLLRLNFTEFLLENINKSNLLTEIELKRFIEILYNISRHEDGADELNEFNALNVLSDFQSTHSEQLDKSSTLFLSMSIALLSISGQNQLEPKRIEKILNQLLQIIIETSKQEDHRHHTIHLSEPLTVLSMLFSDDHHVEFVLSQTETTPPLNEIETIELFVKLLEHFQSVDVKKTEIENYTCLVLLDILWSISFLDRYRPILINIDHLETIIRSFSSNHQRIDFHQYVPRSMGSMEITAEGILDNLEFSTDLPERKVSDEQNFEEFQPMKIPIVMISYCHRNDSFCDKILEKFEKFNNSFEVWIDRTKISSGDDLWEKITEGVKSCDLFLCILSKSYFASKSCRKEFKFAVKRNKTILPVHIGKPGECDWADIHLEDIQYTHFPENSMDLDDERLEKLVKNIKIRIGDKKETSTEHSEIHSHAITALVPLSPQPNPNVSNWTIEDIAQWFDKYKVPKNFVQLFDFQSVDEMQKYRRKLLIDKQQEFFKWQQRYEKKYDGEALEEYIFDRLIKALDDLPEDPAATSQQLKVPAAAKKKNQTKFCNIL